MRKYGKLLLVLGVLAASPAWAIADGAPATAGVQKQRNQKKAEEVGYALKRARINGYDLSVEVKGDAVKIDGKVRDVTHRALAENVVRKVAGVRFVQNNLKYVGSARVQQTSGTFADSAVRPAYHMTEGNESNIQQMHFQKPGKRRPTSTSSTRRTTTSRPVTRSTTAQFQSPAPPKMTFDIAEVPAPTMPEIVAPAMPELPAIETPDATTQTALADVIATPFATEPVPAPPAEAAPAPQQQPTARGNQAVAQDIANNLAQVGLVGYPVEIRYENGTATLAGEVASSSQRQAAEFAASRVGEVTSVSNNLQVTGPIAQTAATTAAPVVSPATMSYPASMPAPMGMMPGATVPAGMMGAPVGAPTPMGAAGNYSNPQMPNHAWPAYAQYPNSAAVQYPTQYSPSAFPYIGPFYPYPQVPMGWREAKLEWDDGYWQLNFEKKKDIFHWLYHPKFAD